jgi:hypothetical protein
VFLATIQRITAREQERDRRHEAPVPDLPETMSQWLAATVSVTPSRIAAHPRPRFSDHACALLAHEYAMLIEQRDRTPIVTLARRHGLRLTTVRMRIHLARQRGFLTRPMSRSYRGGKLTEQGRAALKT